MYISWVTDPTRRRLTQVASRLQPVRKKGNAVRKLLIVCVVVLGACGGGDTTESDQGGSADTPTTQAQASSGDDQSAATEPPSTEAPADAGGSSNEGSITLTIGDETFEFDGALCAYYNAEPGQPGSEWNVSFTDDGGQVYADVTGDYPALSYGPWSAEGADVVFAYDGDTITAEATFQNDNGLPAEEGTFSATCASWYSG